MKKGDSVILKETGEFFTVEEISPKYGIGISREGLSLWVDEEDLEKIGSKNLGKVI